MQFEQITLNSASSDTDIQWIEPLTQKDDNLISGIFEASNGLKYCAKLVQKMPKNSNVNIILNSYITNVKNCNLEPVTEIINAIDSKNFWSFMFYNIEQQNQIVNSIDCNKKTGYDTIGTGNAFSIFTTIIQILKIIAEKYFKVNVIEFVVTEQSQISLYKKFINKVTNNLGWRYQEIMSPDNKNVYWLTYRYVKV
jgi:hypothetical protein